VRDLLGKSLLLGTRFIGHLGVIYDDELADLRELAVILSEAGRQLDDLGEALVLATEGSESRSVADGFRIG